MTKLDTWSCQVLRWLFLASIKRTSEHMLFTQVGGLCVYLVSLLPGWGMDHQWGKREGSSFERAHTVQNLLEEGISREMVAVNQVFPGNCRQQISSLLTEWVNQDFQRRESFQYPSVQSARFCRKGGSHKLEHFFPLFFHSVLHPHSVFSKPLFYCCVFCCLSPCPA